MGALHYFILVSTLAFASAIVCPPNYCNQVQCQDVACDPDFGRLQENGGFCGCCDVCVTFIEDGDFCRPIPLLGAPVTKECRPGSVCDPKQWKCVSRKQRSLSSCQAEQQAFDNQTPPVLGGFRPVCDDDGSYAAKQCQGSKCYCVDKRGSPIKEYQANLWEATNMQCGCAREQQQIELSGVIGKWVSCDAKGDYASVQCTGSVCYCVHPQTGEQTSQQTVAIWQMHILNC